MKKIIAIMLTGIMAVSLAACGSMENSNPSQTQTQENEIREPVNSSENSSERSESTDAQTDQNTDEPNEESAEKQDVLILYFSADNTKDVDAVSSATPIVDGMSSVEWIANIIHDKVGGDIVPIIPSEDYPLEYNDLADYAKQEQDDGGRPLYEDLGIDPASYSTVFIGYPIWWYEMPMIMDTFFETNDFSGATIIPFNTHAGSGDGGTYSDIRELEPNATVLDGLAVSGENAGKDNTRADIETWLEGLDLD